MISTMQIVSLLPSLTELVCEFGRGDALVGVTHECDYPPGVERLPHLTRSRIKPGASSAEIDRLVAEQRGSLYELDTDRLADLRPTLILTQEQCDVCAVNEETVRRSAATLPGAPHVESVNPTDLAGVFAVFRRIGELLGASVAAENLVGRFESTAAEIARRRQGQPAIPTLLLEWTDPPFTAGHWNLEIIALAGGREVLGQAGQASRRVSWEEVLASQAEVVLVAPCGYTLEQTEAELPALAARPGWDRLPAVRRGFVSLIDGSAYFSRPGPRLEESIRIAAAAINPERCGDLAPPTGWRRLFLTV
ncbi:cobalamin-binding protein [soil metagenome]